MSASNRSSGTPKARAQQGIQSVEVAARLLQALLVAPRAQMLRDLAASARMPPAKAHRYLVSLGRIGLVEQHLETGLYDLGPFALELGLSATARLDFVTTAGPALVALRETIKQTVALAVWGNRGATIVRWLGADTPVSAGLRVGSVMPLTRSATGGAFLAFSPQKLTAAVLKYELEMNRRIGVKPDTPEQVKLWVTRTRRQGYSYTTDFIPGIGGIAAPVFDHAGSMPLALVALGYTKPFESGVNSIAHAVLRVAGELSERFGWKPSNDSWIL
jgi:DNA-binding IclR family transcriptional regulator